MHLVDLFSVYHIASCVRRSRPRVELLFYYVVGVLLQRSASVCVINMSKNHLSTYKGTTFFAYYKIFR